MHRWRYDDGVLPAGVLLQQLVFRREVGLEQEPLVADVLKKRPGDFERVGVDDPPLSAVPPENVCDFRRKLRTGWGLRIVLPAEVLETHVAGVVEIDQI